MSPWLLSVLAVVGGFVAMAVIVMVATVVAVKAMGLDMANLKKATPPPAYIAVNLTYSFAAAVVGGYLAALIAGRAPLAHGIALGALMLVMSAVSAMQSKGRQPGWYLAALAVASPVFCIFGAWLRAQQM